MQCNSAFRTICWHSQPVSSRMAAVCLVRSSMTGARKSEKDEPPIQIQNKIPPVEYSKETTTKANAEVQTKLSESEPRRQFSRI